MVRSVRILFKEAEASVEFKLCMENAKEKTPKWWWTNDRRIIYATMYMGWLLGKGMYDRKNYK